MLYLCMYRFTLFRYCYVLGFKPKILKPEFFVRGVVALFVGFPHTHRIKDGYARCLLCRLDLSIADRGILTLFDHWRTEGHFAKEQKYRLMTRRPLLNKKCKEVSAKEREKIEAKLATEAPVFMESPLGVDLAERLQMEDDAEQAGGRPVVSELASHRLWLATFVDNFVVRCNFEGVLSAMSSWAQSMRTELDVAVLALDYKKAQVCMLRVIYVVV